MENILHATFANADDGIRAAESLLYHGVLSEEINLILPQPQDIEAVSAGAPLKAAELAAHSTSEGTATLPTAFVIAAAISANDLLPEPPQLTALFRRTALRHYDELPETPGAPGYRYDALGAVIPDRSPTKAPNSPIGSGNAVVDTEQGAALGLVFGLLTAISIPGVGLIVGSGAIAAGLMATGAVAGGLAGGIYGYLIDRGVDQEVARNMSDHLAGGGTTLSVSGSGAVKATEIALILKAFGGHLIRPSEHLSP